MVVTLEVVVIKEVVEVVLVNKEVVEKELDSQEDSDLLSLAREMQEEQYESPFIKRKTEQTTTTAAAGDGRVPEESEVEAH